MRNVTYGQTNRDNHTESNCNVTVTSYRGRDGQNKHTHRRTDRQTDSIS